MGLTVGDPYGRAYMGKPVYLNYWPIWACYLGPIWVHYWQLIWACPYGTLMGLPICASPYTSHTGPIWACYLGHTWVHYWRVYMRVSALGLAVWDHHTWGPYWLDIWAPHGSIMGSPYWLGRIHHKLGPYGIAIWALHRSIMGVLIWAYPYGTHREPLWAWYLGPTCVHYGQLILDCPYVIHMGPIRACPYRQTGIHPILRLNRFIIWAHLVPVWACPYVLDRMGPIWILYGRPHMGNSYASHTWPIWDCYLGHTWVHYALVHIGPIWIYYMGLAEWDPYGSYKGVSIWASSYTSHTGPI